MGRTQIWLQLCTQACVLPSRVPVAHEHKPSSAGWWVAVLLTNVLMTCEYACFIERNSSRSSTCGSCQAVPVFGTGRGAASTQRRHVQRGKRPDDGSSHSADKTIIRQQATELPSQATSNSTDYLPTTRPSSSKVNNPS
jgi:hypothetical protein